MTQNYSNWGRWGPDDEKGMLNEEFGIERKPVTEAGATAKGNVH